MGVLTSAVMCLALNIYNEARGEPIRGQYAVAHVVMNRKEDPRWPSETCDVIYQRAQFSWTLERFTIKDLEALDLAIKIAEDVLDGNYQSPIECADHYHNHTVRPTWTRNMRIEAVIGNHIFYCSE
jgi:N-acetylmuramoyl-L-alanine amidase